MVLSNLFCAAPFFSVYRRGLAGDFLKMMDEVVGVFVSYLVTDFVYLQGGIGKQGFRFGDACQMKILDRWHQIVRAEFTTEAVPVNMEQALQRVQGDVHEKVVVKVFFYLAEIIRDAFLLLDCFRIFDQLG